MARVDKEKFGLMEGLFDAPNNPNTRDAIRASAAKRETDIRVPIDKMLDFHTEVVGRPHPFRRHSKQKLAELAASIEDNGLITPIRLRPDAENEGCYEVIAGHNRRDAFGLLGKTELSTASKEIEIVDLDDDAAVRQMLTTNLEQRDQIPTMDKAWGYRIWMENNKRNAGRKNRDQFGPQKKSAEILADETGESMTNIKRLVRLTYLIEELQNSVDLEVLQVNTAYELSFMSEQQQEEVLGYIKNDHKLSIAQAKSIREKSEDRLLLASDIEELFDNKPDVNPMKTFFKATEKRFKKYDKDKLARVDADVLEDMVAKVIDTYLAQL